VIASTTLLSPV